MKTLPWLVAVVLAAVGGFVAGRTAPESGDAEAKAQTAGGVGEFVPSKSTRGRPEPGGKGTPREQLDRRMNSIRELLREQNRRWTDDDDPFGDNGPLLFDDSRLHALIYQAAESDFPALLDIVLDEEEGMWVGNYRGHDVLDVMLRRWCDFDPKAVLQWLERQPDGAVPKTLHQHAIIAAEAIDSDPEWALGMMAEWYQRDEDVPPPPDPFGGEAVQGKRTLKLGGDSFFYRLTMLHPERALEAMRSGVPDFMRDGGEGWMDAMFELGRGAEIPGMLAGVPDEQQMMGAYGRLLQQHDPRALQAWLEGRPPDVNSDRLVVRSEEWGSDAWLERIEWYLERGAGTEGVERRMTDFARSELSGRDRADEILAILEERGVSVESLRAALFWGATDRSAFVEAYRRLEDVPSTQRDGALDHLFGNASRSHWIRLGDLSLRVFEASDTARDLAEQHGYGDAYRTFIQERNEVVAGKVLEFMEAQSTE